MYYIISASPNKDGTTAACARAALSGITAGGGQAEHIDLCAIGIKPCMQCGNGWGICRESHHCVIEDALNEIQEKLSGAQGVFLITPVYWGMPAEHMRYFMDRFRRCEAIRGDDGALAGKKINFVAAAGGSGNGTVTCLADLELWSRHIRAVPTERISVNRFNRDEALPLIEKAAERMAKG